MRRVLGISTVALAMVSALIIAPVTVLGDGGGGGRLAAVPWVFVGTAAQCAPSPAGSRIVTSAWLGGMGLPDNGGLNGAAATASDPHLGLLLNKNGLTSDCSSSGATITGVKGTIVTAASKLGFDYRNGGHCGAGAPRYNVVVKDPSPATTTSSHFVGGCQNGTLTPAGQDPAEWTQARFDLSNPAQAFPPILTGSKIVSLDIVFDEGTNTANNDTQGVGLAVLDNIFVNGTTIPSGSGIQPGSGGRGDNNGEGGKHGDGGDTGEGGNHGNGGGN